MVTTQSLVSLCRQNMFEPEPETNFSVWGKDQSERIAYMTLPRKSEPQTVKASFLVHAKVVRARTQKQFRNLVGGPEQEIIPVRKPHNPTTEIEA